MNRSLAALFAFALVLTLGCAPDTPLGRHGRLQVVDRHLADAAGRPVQLRGVSSYNIAGYDWLFTDAALKELRDDWKADVVRFAMYTDPMQAGYLGNPQLEKTVDKLVAAAGKAGLYTIVDWHILRDGDPLENLDAAVDFWGRAAARYRGQDHVLFEICNEPNGPAVTWNDRIRPYAEKVLAAIRAADPTRIVLVGTATWSQDVDLAAQAPLADPQVMYVFHWYAGTHGQELRDKIDKALPLIPLFNTEWGSTEASGGGEPRPAETAVWLKFLDDRYLSSCNWSLSTVREGSAALKPKYEQQGPMASFLTSSGVLVHDYLRAPRK